MDYLVYKNFLAHSKGDWKEHKYIRKEGKRYFYSVAVKPNDADKDGIEYDYANDDRLTDEDKENIRLHFASDPELKRMYLEYRSARDDYNTEDKIAKSRPKHLASAQNARKKYEAAKDAYANATSEYVEEYLNKKSSGRR